MHQVDACEEQVHGDPEANPLAPSPDVGQQDDASKTPDTTVFTFIATTLAIHAAVYVIPSTTARGRSNYGNQAG